MLEGGLTLVAFVSLFMGAVDIAQIMMVHQALIERVRYAARATAVSCCDTDRVKNLVMYAQTTTPQSATAFYGLNANNITVTFADQDLTSKRVTIRVSGFQYKSFTPMMMGTANGIPVQVTIPLETP